MSWSVRNSGKLICATAGFSLIFAFVQCSRPQSGHDAGAMRASPVQGGRFVRALGNIVTGETPTESEVQLSEFLFGAPPELPLGLMKPGALAVFGDTVFIGDTALATVFAWHAGAGVLEERRLSRDLRQPVGMDVGPAGDLFVVDAAAGFVRRFDASGRETMRYAPSGESFSADGFDSDGPGDRRKSAGSALLAEQWHTASGGEHGFRPADVLVVGDELWISNVAAHRIDVFELASGRPKRCIGERGRGPGQFGMPLGMARMGEDRVYVVDMLNARVQVLTLDGVCRQMIGGPGDRVGRFGRPKDVAVGPDGVVFVLDAASQRVHAFTPDGRAMLAFGGPRERVGALSVPAAIAISERNPMRGREFTRANDAGGGTREAVARVEFTAHRAVAPENAGSRAAAPGDSAAHQEVADGSEPAYYVLVAEQVLDAGVRVYAWSGDALASVPPVRHGSAVKAARAESPHWKRDRCGDCHEMSGGRAMPIAPAEADRLCLSCHDGTNASAEPHPIHRPGHADMVSTPAEWPLVDGRLTCLTCHDILRHCEVDVVRPEVNPVLLRGTLSENPLDFCMQCHKPDESWRLSPHQQVDADGRIRLESCGFCHAEAPTVPRDGLREGYSFLRAATSEVCLTCHVRHWDYFPEGHVDRPAPAKVREALGLTESTARGMTTEGRLPLSRGNVTCFSCHNPHDEKLFAPGSELGMRATRPEDARVDLRMDRTELCLSCHRW